MQRVVKISGQVVVNETVSGILPLYLPKGHVDFPAPGETCPRSEHSDHSLRIWSVPNRMSSISSWVHLIYKCNCKEISFPICKEQGLWLPNSTVCFKSLKSPLSATKALSFVVISC